MHSTSNTQSFCKLDRTFVAQFIGENNRLMGTVKDVARGVASVELENGDMVKALAINMAKGIALQSCMDGWKSCLL